MWICISARSSVGRKKLEGLFFGNKLKVLLSINGYLVLGKKGK